MSNEAEGLSEIEALEDSTNKASEPLSRDDIIHQAAEAGKAAVDMGKKTGKLLFNAARLGGKAFLKGVEAYKGNIDKEKERMADWPDVRLADVAKRKAFLSEGMAALQILKERGVKL